jgi:hypothetical protein
MESIGELATLVSFDMLLKWSICLEVDGPVSHTIVPNRRLISAFRNPHGRPSFGIYSSHLIWLLLYDCYRF